MQSQKKFFTIMAFIAFSFMANAQSKQPDPKPFVVHTMYLNRSAETIHIKLDSLLKVYKENVMDKNPYFADSKIVMHWWGHDSREVIQMCELKNMNELEAAFDQQNSLFMGYVKTHKKFADQWLSVFLRPEHHSDEIYRVVE
jgi:hypothetical protein